MKLRLIKLRAMMRVHPSSIGGDGRTRERNDRQRRRGYNGLHDTSVPAIEKLAGATARLTAELLSVNGTLSGWK